MARAAVLHAVGGELDLRDDVTAVPPGPDEVRVRVRATGVCHTDLSAMTGGLPTAIPAVLGHEGAGEIVEVGERVAAVAPGDHVVINWTPDCGVCGDCERGRPFLCTVQMRRLFKRPRFALDGAGPAVYGMGGCGTWTEEVTLPWQGVVKIADDVPFEYAALFGCGLPTGLGAVFNTAGVRPGATVAVVGAGGVGLAVVQGARIAGASDILAVDPNPAKHPLAKEFGATRTATPDELDAHRGRFDHVFEVVGRSAAVATAYALARRGGEVIVVGVAPPSERHETDLAGLVFANKALRGSLYGECDLRRDIPVYVDLWRAGRLDVENLITRRIRFEELNDAVAVLERGEAIRQVVLFD